MGWILFLVIVFALLALDLGVFHKSNKKVSIKESLAWTCVWVILAFLFGGVIYYIYDTNAFGLNAHSISGKQAMLEYFTGYIIEESLSMDNIFVIAMIFSFFKIEPKYQHNILFWGILGAVFFRLIMIVLGTEFVARFEWSMYIFGGILIYSAYKMFKEGDEESDFQDSVGVKILSKIYPIDWTIQNGKYLVRKDKKKVATGLLATLVVVEFTDVLFAVDSIPAIFSVTKDPFIVFTSNIFAILGLRNLYFFLSNMMDRFEYVKYALILILLFVGVKMLLHHFIDISIVVSLLVILGALTTGVLYSLYASKSKKWLDN